MSLRRLRRHGRDLSIFQTAIQQGFFPCGKCGRSLPLRCTIAHYAPPSIRATRGVHIYCYDCEAGSYESLDGLALNLPQGRDFFQAHPRIRALPQREIEHAGGAAQTGLTAFFNFLPIVLAGFFGGTIVDRLGYKRMSIVADIASGITVAFVPLLFGLGLLPFWLLLVLVFLSSLLDAPGSTARAALVPELAEAAAMPLERASSLLQIVERVSRLVGAPLAGLLVAVMGAQNVLWLDAATFAISAAMVAFLVPAAQTITPTIKQRYTSDLAEGLRFLRQDRLLLVLIGTVMITNFLDAAKGSDWFPPSWLSAASICSQPLA